jgi:hypothetical protein
MPMLNTTARALAVPALALTAVGLLTLAGGCSSSGSGADAGPAPTIAPEPVSAQPATVRAYERHITTLANAETMAGRLPGTEGIERAANYIERHFRSLGLEPAFPELIESDGALIVSDKLSYRQPFEVAGGTSVNEEEIDVTHADGPETDLEPGTDFNVLGYGAAGEVEGPLAFVGYSITGGQDGYDSYAGTEDLEGAVALMVRFEPYGEDGKSLWTEQGWTGAAGLAPKFRNAAERGASAILIVNPPNADDPRVDTMMTAMSTGWGGGPIVDIPVAMVSAEGAETLISVASDGQATLDELILQANASGGVTVFEQSLVDVEADLDSGPITTDNVGAILPGRGALADELVVVGAHYDHVGYGPYGTRSPGQMHPGADDNASGTSAVLTSAALVKRAYDALPEGAEARSVLFLLFTAEESGLNGSRYYANNPIRPVEDHYVMVNMDMIGSYGDGQGLEVGALNSGDGLAQLFGPILDASGLDIREDTGVATGRSDHASFDNVGIPNMFMFTGITDEYHTPDDTLDTIDTKGAALISSLASKLILAAATNPTDIAFVDRSAGRARIGGPMNVRVRVGIAPESYAGNDGILVGRVFEGTSADLGGVEAGDRVIKWGGQEITSVESWMPMLGGHQPGDMVDIVVVRDGEEVELTLELQARQQDG